MLFKLVLENNYSQTETAKNLGINPKNLHRWIANFKKNNTVTAQKLITPEQIELIRLRKEIKRLTQLEREILKKAAAFFASESI